MIQKAIRYVEQNQMLRPQDAVAAGISGGADSVCLLFLLTKLRETVPFRLLAVHINHGIRAAADEDEAYVKKLCEQWQVPFFSVKEDVAALAKAQGISEEEAGRNLRYETFEKILKQEAPREWEQGNAKIAVAHNQNDRAETMLFHLVRGTGIQGLCSIPPVRDRIIRPLLCLSRREIEEILEMEKLAYCIDSTNAENNYTRNKIRNCIFPYITEEISPAAIEKMNHTADLLSEARDYIQKEVEEAWERVLLSESEEQGGRQVRIGINALLKEAHFLQGQLILAALEKVYPGRKDITSAHVHAIQNLCKTQGSKTLNLPYGIHIQKEYDSLKIIREPEQSHANAESIKEAVTAIEVSQIPGSYSIGAGREMEFTVFPYKKDAEIPQNQCTKWFDYDKIEKSLVIRKRKSGDYLTITDELSRKSLKEYLIGEKIPRLQRDDLWILAEESHVLWVVGHRISTKYKISENTKRILQVQLRGGTSWQNM